MGKEMVTRKTWEEFRAAGLLWWANRVLHVFGWAIVVIVDEDNLDGPVQEVYPARVRFRGFDENTEAQEHSKLSDWMAQNVETLVEEANE